MEWPPAHDWVPGERAVMFEEDTDFEGRPAEVEAVISCLGESVERIRSLRDRSDYLPEPWAKAWTDAVLLAESSDPIDPWAAIAYEHAAAQLAAADDHIVGLEALLLDTETAAAPYALARAAMEASGRAFLLLDPGISDRERALLSIAETLTDLRAIRAVMRAHEPGDIPRDVAADLRKVEEQIRAVKAHVRKHGLTVPQRPSFTAVIEHVLRSPEDRGLGPLAVALHSAVAHAVPHILVTVTVGDERLAAHPSNVGLVPLTDRKVLDIALAVLLAYSRAVSRQVEVNAWPPSSWTRWMAHVRAVMRRALG